MKSIDIFNVISFEVFYRCLDSFPVPLFISSKELAGRIKYCLGELISTSEIKDLDDKSYHTLMWLRDEGYITSLGAAGDGFTVVLSQKGLTALNVMPVSLSGENSDTSFGDKISEGIENVAVNTLTGLMIEFFK